MGPVNQLYNIYFLLLHISRWPVLFVCLFCRSWVLFPGLCVVRYSPCVCMESLQVLQFPLTVPARAYEVIWKR